MIQARFTAAIGTPLTEEECLHVEGLRLQMQSLLEAGIEGVLAAGSMGAMQLLTHPTYADLVRHITEIAAGKCEVLVGAGDTGLARTRERILYLNGFRIDGVAVLAPFFWNFSQEELIEYYRALADVSRAPLYLYDLPQVTHTKLSLETILTLSSHPNIRGAKLSCEVSFARQLIDRVDPGFRVIVAAPDLVDVLLRSGIREHLDGMWTVAPRWTVAIGRAAAQDQWDQAAGHQRDLTALRNLIVNLGFAVFTEIMNARGIPGEFAPRPCRRLSEPQRQSLLAEPILRRLLQEDSVRRDNKDNKGRYPIF